MSETPVTLNTDQEYIAVQATNPIDIMVTFAGPDEDKYVITWSCRNQNNQPCKVLNEANEPITLVIASNLTSVSPTV
jgi:hypothetical protein